MGNGESDATSRAGDQGYTISEAGFRLRWQCADILRVGWPDVLTDHLIFSFHETAGVSLRFDLFQLDVVRKSPEQRNALSDKYGD